MKTIEVDQTTRACPDCGWKPVSMEASARYGELIDHVMALHGMGKPEFGDRTVFVTGQGGQKCEVARFIRY
jgi:hypothetical protein